MIHQAPLRIGLALLAALGMAGAAQAEGRCPGSLLLFPEFDNRDGATTIFTVTNASEDENVRVEFVYRGRYGLQGQLLDCLETNFTRVLTKNDTVSLITRAQNPNMGRGFAYVFAKDLQDQKIVHNWLIGNELHVDGVLLAEYSVNPLVYTGIGDGTRNSVGNRLTDVDGDGMADLNGCEYEKSPGRLIFPRFFGQNDPFQSELVLVALRGGRSFTTSVDFLMYNDNEEVFSRQYSFRCWARVPLTGISGLFSNDFLAQNTNDAPGEVVGLNDQEAGWFQAEGGIAQSINTAIVDPAIYAVLVERVAGKLGADLPFEDGLNGKGDLFPLGITGDPVVVPCD